MEQKKTTGVAQLSQERQDKDEHNDDQRTKLRGFSKFERLAAGQKRIENLVAIQWVERKEIEKAQRNIRGSEDRHKLHHAYTKSVCKERGGQKTYQESYHQAKRQARHNSGQGNQQRAAIRAAAQLPGIGFDGFAPAKADGAYGYLPESQDHAEQCAQGIEMRAQAQALAALRARRGIAQQ